MTAAASSAWVSSLAEEHLDAAYNLGRWLLGNEQDAADAVHDAFVRATRSAHTYAGGNVRAWWLAIVRNCCIAALNARRRETPRADAAAAVDDFDLLANFAFVQAVLGRVEVEHRRNDRRAVRAVGEFFIEQ